MNANAARMHLPRLLCGLLLLISLTACAAASIAQLPPPPSPAPHAAEMRTHAPLITRVVEREAVEDGTRYFYKDIYFRDTHGDATLLANDVTGMDPEGGLFLSLTDDVVSASPDQQKQEAHITVRYGCPNNSVDPFDFTVEDRLQDQSGSLSAPVRFNISCPAATPPNTLPFTIAGALMGLGLLAAIVLYLRAHPSRGQPLLLSVLLLLSALLPASFAQMVLHEGGHALMDLPRLVGHDLTLYVHPFVFNGYSRPVYQWSNAPAHAAGAVVGILGALLISLPFWKRRSLPLAAVVMLLPWAVLSNGGYIASVTGDFHNLLQLSGLPPLFFNIVGLVIALAGLLLLFALLPLFGLPPGDRRALLVIPAALFAWGLLSKLVAALLVPGSPFARRWHLGGEILLSTNEYVALVAFGLLAAVLYVTVYRWAHPWLPAWLRTEPVASGWQGLALPGIVAALSIAVGLIVILF